MGKRKDKNSLNGGGIKFHVKKGNTCAEMQESEHEVPARTHGKGRSKNTVVGCGTDQDRQKV